MKRENLIIAVSLICLAVAALFFSFAVPTPPATQSGEYTWTEKYNINGIGNWRSIASSYDGTKLAAVSLYGYICTSTDSGATWTACTKSGKRRWTSITSSGDGTYLAACARGDYIYISTDSGKTWVPQTEAERRDWNSITSSSDGVSLAACTYGDYIYVSDNLGINWRACINSGKRYWSSITLSSQGKNLAACESGTILPSGGYESRGYIYISNDYGNTWTPQTELGQHSWTSITSSPSGTYLVACAVADYIFTTNLDSDGQPLGWTQMGDRNFWTSVALSPYEARFAACAPNGIYTATTTIDINGYPETWTLASPQMTDERREWCSIASSLDGTKLAACASNDYIYTSTDVTSGVTWTKRAAPGSKSWSSITSFSNGTGFAACTSPGYIYISTNSGKNWTEKTAAGRRNWSSITSSSDGTKLAACTMGNYIYISTDSGITWIPRMTDANRLWTSITSTLDGRYLAACTGGDHGLIYTSDNYGVNWREEISAGYGNWSSIAYSPDSTYGICLAACMMNGYFYTSTNLGETWIQYRGWGTHKWSSITVSPGGSNLLACESPGYIYRKSLETYSTRKGESKEWRSIASSLDGTKLAACTANGYIYISTDSGDTWTPETAVEPSTRKSITISPDGTRIAACEQSGFIHIGGMNQSPVLIAIGDKMVNAGKELKFTITATDPNSDPLTYSANNLPAGATFRTDLSTKKHTFKWTPSLAQAGTYRVTFTVTDGKIPVEETISIIVKRLIAIPKKGV